MLPTADGVPLLDQGLQAAVDSSGIQATYESPGLGLLAVLKAVHCFTLSLHLDNVTATSYLNKEGVTRSAALNRLTLDILKFLSHCITLIPVYLPGYGKSGSGCPLKGSGVNGMVLEPQCGGEDFQEIREASGGSVRCQEVYSSPHLLLSGEKGSQQDSMPWIRISEGCMPSLHLS